MKESSPVAPASCDKIVNASGIHQKAAPNFRENVGAHVTQPLNHESVQSIVASQPDPRITTHKS